MGERSDQIEEEINRTRGDLNQNIRELEEKARSAFDWRDQFENRPATLLAIAFGGGVLASALFPMRHRRRYTDRERVYVRTQYDDGGGNESAASRRDARRKNADKANGDTYRAKNGSLAMGALKAAVVGVAASRAKGVFGDLLAGYRDELRRMRHDRNDFSRS